MKYNKLFIGYPEYLLSCLIKLHDNEFNELPYDQQYDKLIQIYESFVDSKYDDHNRELYECMEEYIRDKF